jgi:hypothetical protein
VRVCDIAVEVDRENLARKVYFPEAKQLTGVFYRQNDEKVQKLFRWLSYVSLSKEN